MPTSSADTRPKAFVLMPFSDEFGDLYELGIRAACEAANVDCERVDEKVFQDLIISKIYQEIANCDVIIADVTGRNPNVFYELGYAHALHKKTIILVSSASEIPFDLTMHQHIIYNGSIRNVRNRLESHLNEALNFSNIDSFDLADLEITQAPHLKGKDPRQSALTPLSEGSTVSTPAELSNYGRGFFFDMLLAVKNNSNTDLDLRACEIEISFPSGLHIGHSSLRSGIGKHARDLGDDGRQVVYRFSSRRLAPMGSERFILSLQSNVASNGAYQTVFPVTVRVCRGDEFLRRKFNLELKPIIRMN